MTQPYPLTGTLPTPSTRKRLPLRLRSNGLRGSAPDQDRQVGISEVICQASRNAIYPQFSDPFVQTCGTRTVQPKPVPCSSQSFLTGRSFTAVTRVQIPSGTPNT